MTKPPVARSVVGAQLSAMYAGLPPKRRERASAKRLASGHLVRRTHALAAVRAAAAGRAPVRDGGLSLETVDAMTGRQFEEFLIWLFSDRGIEVSLTPATADRGADLLITREDGRQLIQAKRHSLASRVSGDAVREAMAARVHYGIASAAVVTNAFFTVQAQETARENDIELVDREALATLLARAKERRARSPKDDPRRQASRGAVAPLLDTLRDGGRRLPKEPRSSARTDQPWLRQACQATVLEADLVLRRAREFVAAADTLLNAFMPNRAEQAYDLAIPDDRLPAVIASVDGAFQNLLAAHEKLAARQVPTRLRGRAHAESLLKASSSAFEGTLRALLGGGLDRDDDLLSVRHEQAIAEGRAEAARHLDTAAYQTVLLRDVARRGDRA